MAPSPSVPSQPWAECADECADALPPPPDACGAGEDASRPPAPPPPAFSGTSAGSKASKNSLASEAWQVELRSGWLLKRSGGVVRPVVRRAASAAAGTSAQGLFWRPRYFILTGATISYCHSEAEARCERAAGTLQVMEIDDVVVDGPQVLLHFAVSQHAGSRDRTTLCLCGSSAEEAEDWAGAIRQATAARLRAMLPSGWDVGTMLSGRSGVAKRVIKVDLRPGDKLVSAIQDLVDDTFICKKTRDRRGLEVPVRIEVEKVVCVQNVGAWMAYERARERVRERFRTSDAPPLMPEVLTASSIGACPDGPSFGLLDEESNEQWLFHGTTVCAADGITDSEFRMDLAGTHRGTLYGKAVYLAECASKADEYSEEDNKGCCRMLLCRAALGSVLVEREKKPSAPELEAECRRRYDSLCGDRWAAVGTFREYVLYESSQVYPEYIIYYRRMHQGDLLQAIGQFTPEECETSERARRLVPHAATLAQTHPDPQARYRISLLLGAHSHTVVPALASCLKDESALRRKTAAAALAHVADFTALSRGSAVSTASEDSKDKERASPLIMAVPALVACLADTNEAVRKATAQALEQIGGVAAKLAIPALAAQLADPSEEVRCAVAKALEKMGGEAAAAAVPKLATCLQDANVSVRKAAIAALGQMGSAVAPALPALIECLQNTSSCVRCAAATSLAKLGPSAVSGVPALLTCLSDENVGVRTTAAIALGKLGNFAADSSDTADALCETLLDCHEGVRAATATALGRLGKASTVPVLVEALKDTSEDVRKAAAVALGTPAMRPVATSSIPQLTKALKDMNEDVRKAAAVSLGAYGSAANSATAGITACLSDTTVSVRKAAAIALGQIGNPSRATLQALNERLKDPNEGVRKAAVKAHEYLSRRRQEHTHLTHEAFDFAGFDTDLAFHERLE